MAKPIYIDEKINFHTGNKAIETLSKENDQKFTIKQI